MTLRLRLVLGLVVLVTAGLAVFGFATYELYSRSQYDRLDSQMRTSTPSVVSSLAHRAGLASDGDAPGHPDGHGPGRRDGSEGGGPGGHAGPPPVVPLAHYAELRSTDGAVVTSLVGSSTSAVP